MLSICIPVFNFDINSLVCDLYNQAMSTGIPFEIIIMDDASDLTFRENNKKCLINRNIKYIQLEKNKGRSRIRNQLWEMAQYEWILFMDCDSACTDNFFLKRYLSELDNAEIICGGRQYTKEKPKDSTLLHWYFGKNREVTPAEIRSRNPYKSFMTNNFMLKRSIKHKVMFNNRITSYGHEDTLFGFRLKELGIRIKHTNNPLIHVGLQQSEEFLEKVKVSTQNLLKIYQISKYSKELANSVSLLKCFLYIKRAGITGIVSFSFKLFDNLLVKNLKSRTPYLFLLDIYKLGCICREYQLFKMEYPDIAPNDDVKY